MNKAIAEAPGAPSDAEASAPNNNARKMIIGTVAAVVVIVGAIIGVRHWSYYASHEETDDAQVEGDVSPVLPRVSGYVTKVFVKDNEHVTAGQALMDVDPKELDLRVSSADAALQNAIADHATAEATLASTRAEADTAAANVETALVRQRKAASDLERDTNLAKTGAITDSQLADTRAAADTASAELATKRTEAETAKLQISVAAARVAAARTSAAEKVANLDYERLQRSYASVTAPISGLVSRKSVEPGQYVQSGQTLLSITSDDDVWAVANFKETQLTRMKEGQDVEFEADSYPGYTFHGKVQSIAGATGARFALLPPDNSTGNFVKVTQRVPVKIVLTQTPDAEHQLRPGMSIDATVSVAQ